MASHFSVGDAGCKEGHLSDRLIFLYPVDISNTDDILFMLFRVEAGHALPFEHEWALPCRPPKAAGMFFGVGIGAQLFEPAESGFVGVDIAFDMNHILVIWLFHLVSL